MAVYVGQAFISKEVEGIPSHLWIVLSDPLKNARVVIANLSSKPCPSGEECVIKAGEHSFCSHDSYVRFQEVRVVDSQRLEEGLKAGVLRQSRDADHDAPILGRIQRAIAVSKAARLEAINILKAQGYGSER